MLGHPGGGFHFSSTEALTLMAHVRRMIRQIDRKQDDAQIQAEACDALRDLAENDANQVTLMTAGVHVRIIRAMDRHQDDAQVQE